MGNNGLFEDCHGGCGKRVFNRTGFCMKCKPKRLCKCGKEITKIKQHSSLCIKCRAKSINHFDGVHEVWVAVV